MIQFLKKLFGFGERVNLGELIAGGATIIDVRTISEYKNGHLSNAINLPLDTLSSKISTLDNSKAIITCCASGMRSASAKSLLKSYGFTEVHNGGSWTSLKQFDD
jgi:phage shock protein E